MMMQRTSLVRAFVFLLALSLAGSTAAQGTGYPSRPIKIIAPFAPGGQIDLLGRIMGQKLSELWGQPVVVENVSGAGGTIGMDRAAKALPDGYTIAMGSSASLVVAPSLYAKLPYDPLRDLAPVANVAFVPYVLAVNANVPASTVRELIVLARSKKGLLNYGSSGIGSASHLTMELLKAMTGADILQVPYKGTAPVVSAIASGDIDMAFVDVPVVTPYAKAGKLRLLAVAGSSRVTAAPQLPTMAEAGLEGYAVESWIGIVAPAGTPSGVIDKLNSAIVNALKAADVRQHFNRIGYVAIGDTPEQFSATIRAEIKKYGLIIKNANIRAD